MPLAGHGHRPAHLRRRASRPQLKRDPLGGGLLPLRDWSVRQIAVMWIVALALEASVIAIGSHHPVVIDYLPEGTPQSRRIFDSGLPLTGLADSSAHADSLRDSLIAWGKVIADSIVRQFANAEAAAARKAVLLAALVLLPLPLAALVITAGWLWLRRARSMTPVDKAAA